MQGCSRDGAVIRRAAMRRVRRQEAFAAAGVASGGAARAAAAARILPLPDFQGCLVLVYQPTRASRAAIARQQAATACSRRYPQTDGRREISARIDDRPVRSRPWVAVRARSANKAAHSHAAGMHPSARRVVSRHDRPSQSSLAVCAHGGTLAPLLQTRCVRLL